MKDYSSIKGVKQISSLLTLLSGLLIWLLAACGEQPSDQLSQTPALASTNSTATIPTQSPMPISKENITLPPVKVAIGGAAPNFAATDISDQKIQLGSLLGQGKAIMLNYWSVYCQPCREEAPELVKSFEANKNRLTLIGIDINDESDEVKNFVNEFKIRYPIVIDNTGDLVYKYRVPGRPASIFINQKGVITGINIGLISPQLLEQELAKAMR